MFLDRQQNLLLRFVAAWTNEFSSCAVDCGSWPDRQREHFALRDAEVLRREATALIGKPDDE